MKIVSKRQAANPEASAKKAEALSEKTELMESSDLIRFSDKQIKDRMKPFTESVEALKVEESKMIVTSGNKAACSEFAVRVKKLAKNLDEKRQEFKRPYLEFERTIDGLFQPFIKTLKAIEASVGDKLTAVLREERRLAEEAAAKAAEEARKKAIEEAKKEGLSNAQAKDVGAQVASVIQSNISAAVPSGISTSAGSSKLKEKKDFEVVDQSLVPKGFLMVDRAKVLAAIESGVTEIPGIKIVTINKVQFRSR